jgi:hypothetical protein
MISVNIASWFEVFIASFDGATGPRISSIVFRTGDLLFT